MAEGARLGLTAIERVRASLGREVERLRDKEERRSKSSYRQLIISQQLAGGGAKAVPTTSGLKARNLAN